MKLTLAIFFCFTSLVSLCQEKPVQWNISSQKVNDSVYAVILNAVIDHDWYVYASDDHANDLEAVKIKWNNDQILAKGKIAAQGVTEIIEDRVFGNRQRVFKAQALFRQDIIAGKPLPASLTFKVSAYTSNGRSFLPINEEIELKFEDGVGKQKKLKLSTVNLQQPLSDCGDQQAHQSKSLLGIFLLGFGGGLLALLTPCVFPMIPVTVSFFTNRSKSRRQGISNGIAYGLFIFFIYLLASIPFHLAGNINPQVFNTISTNAWVNVFFFAVFILFALSFFGVFELRLPSFLATKTDSKAGLHLPGIFFMALTLAIVSFSCTGPILGSLLVGSLSSSGGALQLTAGMAGFGVALGLPFALFAIFPNWLQQLPKNGGWLDVVKKSLAFVELALAIKFLSNADLVEHWGLLKREVFIGLWIIIFLALSLYLLNVKWLLRYGKANISKVRLVFGILAFVSSLYLIPGLTQTRYANLKLLSGFPPPLSYSIYGKTNIHGKGLEPDVVNDYEKALALAKQQNKPLLIDFTGWACVNCRKMEEQVWTKATVQQLISENYILVSLYVDDRKQLPGGETVGKKWATFQSENFGQVTQPLYVQLSPDEELLNHPVGYTPGVSVYSEWLQCGIETYQRKKQLAQLTAAP